MTISGRAEPAGGRDFVNDELGKRSHRARHLLALSGTPQTGAPLPVYLLGRDEAAASDPLSAAKLAGWRYPIVGGASAGLASVSKDSSGFKFTGINNGTLPQRLLDAAILADQTLGPRAERYEARLLEIPALRIYALWLAGPTNYFVSLLDGQPPGSSALQIETDILPRIRAALAAVQPRRPAIGGPPTN
jgi:hypothetical protein